jgi:hypothetical protein
VRNEIGSDVGITSDSEVEAPSAVNTGLPDITGICAAYTFVRYLFLRGSEFLKKVKAYAARKNIPFRFSQTHGKGSHGTILLGARATILKDRKKELPTGLVIGMLRQRGIEKDEF